MTLNKKDFQSQNEVRWCPGCGDYAILATVQKTLADLNFKKEDTVFVSGIGCAARFPYYMNTYGMHTIHGRGPAFATGVKLANPKLKVFLVTGDGDGLSIGASHLMHLFRRNVDITVLLFNNQIYGLTKGQYSPTSAKGHVAKSTPHGSLEEPINPISFALAAGASFVARSVDNNAAHLGQVLQAAIAHQGTSFVEILQTCVVFNDDAFVNIREKATQGQHTVFLKDSEPLLFDDCKQAIALCPETLQPQIINMSKDGALRPMIHQPRITGMSAHILAQLTPPNFPTPVGIFKAIEKPTYEAQKLSQDQAIMAKSSGLDLGQLLRGSSTWQI